MQIVKCGDKKGYITLCYSKCGDRIMQSKRNGGIYFLENSKEAKSIRLHDRLEGLGAFLEFGYYVNYMAFTMIKLFQNKTRCYEDCVKCTMIRLNEDNHFIIDEEEQAYIINRKTLNKIDVSKYIYSRSTLYYNDKDYAYLIFSNYAIEIANGYLYIYKTKYNEEEEDDGPNSIVYRTWRMDPFRGILREASRRVNHRSERLYNNSMFIEVFKIKI